MAPYRREARFYVYRLDAADGTCAYIGKGSKNRLKNQIRNFGIVGHEIARFWSETEAYRFERKAITEHRPALNTHPGGNGSRASKPPREFKPKWLREMEKIGTRKYAARMLLRRYSYMLQPEDVDKIRAVACAE